MRAIKEKFGDTGARYEVSDVLEAVNIAREFVFEAIRSAPKLGAGNGPLNHGLVPKGEGAELDIEDEQNPFSVLKNLKD